MNYQYYSRRRRDEIKIKAEQKKVEEQRLKYNLLGILVLLIALSFALNLFNIGDHLTRFLTGN